MIYQFTWQHTCLYHPNSPCSVERHPPSEVHVTLPVACFPVSRVYLSYGLISNATQANSSRVIWSLVGSADSSQFAKLGQ